MSVVIFVVNVLKVVIIVKKIVVIVVRYSSRLLRCVRVVSRLR